jgi:Flp pilus assembly pilin Flp
MTTEMTRNVMSETGQTMAEYAVVLALIVMVTLVAYVSLGDSVSNALEGVRKIFP